MQKKTRLDVAVFEGGYAPSREKAKAIIMAGQVYVNNQKVDKAGFELKEGDKLEVRGKTLKYVSRGGLKLEKAMQVFPITLADKICMDVGASTGGFTDCMLQNGAKKVYAVDVGYGQLDWKLRSDDRVVNLERTNFRNLEPGTIPEVDGTVMDVSFISIAKLFPKLHEIMKDGAPGIWLIKPQFEAGREKVGKHGVVRDPAVHREVLRRIVRQATEAGFTVQGLDRSPIKGPSGNIEFLCFVRNEACSEEPDFEDRIRELTGPGAEEA